ncbi:MAG: alpha-glucosidase [Candidatus Hodarchaeota archaeon]
MIRIEILSDGFNFFYKDYLILHHVSNQPCFKIGIGTARYKSNYGHFRIKEKLKNEFNLENYEIISKSENKISLRFFSSEAELNVSLVDSGSFLIIKPECSNKQINRFWIKIPAQYDEAIYGCGEQYSELNLRGKEVPLWVEEQGIGRGSPPITGDWYTTYYPQPTFVSSNNYYCHVLATSYSKFNFDNEDFHELYIWCIPERIIIGKFDTALEVVNKLSDYLGRQPELPDWVYDGVWLGIQGGTDIVEQKINQAGEKGVKIAGVWCQDWQGIRMMPSGKRLLWNWEYDNKIYPDLPSFIKKLKQKGIRFLGYINSFLAMDSEQFKVASKKGFCIKDQEGNDYDVRTDSQKATMIDLSNSKAIDWLKLLIKRNMINIGLDGWMADYGEYLPIDAVLSSGEDLELFHNKYPVIWAKTIYEAIKEANKIGEIVFFTRAGYSGISKYTTLVWAGDQLVNWSIDDGLASVIPAGISLGICGIGYFHTDIGGFHTFKEIRRDKELFMRWAELEVFSPVMRSHEGVNPDLNWQFDSDDECLEHFAKMSKIYVHLKPYFKHLSNEYKNNGYPLIRALYLHYENDSEVHHIKYQFLLGSDLLIAPVIKPNKNKWKVYFPDDIWIHIWSGEKYKKGWRKVNAPIGQPPIFFRINSKFSELFEQIKNIE